MMLAIALSLALGVGPVYPPPPPPSLPETMQGEDYGEVSVRLRSAHADIERGEASLYTLSEVLLALEAFPAELAADPELRALRGLVRLGLAQAYLDDERATEASSMVDEALRSAFGEPLAIEGFGRKLNKLHDARVDALLDGGYGRLSVSCAVPCRVYVNERAIETEPPPLLLGSYRVHIEASGREDYLAFDESVEVERAEQVVEVEFEARRADQGAAGPPLAPSSTPSSTVPRWASILMSSVGLGMSLSGAVLMGVNRGQLGAARPGTLVSGAVLFGLGASLGGAGSVLLSLDLMREASAGQRQATLSWRLRF